MVSITSSIKKLGALRKGRFGGERGDVAVLTAIFVMILLTLLPLVAYTSAIGQQPTVSFDQKYQGALGAAEAGVAAFVSDLNAGTAVTSSCTISSTSYSNCSTSGAPTNYWTALPASSVSSYEYEAFANALNGPFTIIATGKTTGSYGTVYRTVKETVSQQVVGGSFTNYFLFANSNGNNPFPNAQNNLNGPMLTNGNYSFGSNCPSDAGSSTVLKSSNPNNVGTSNGCNVEFGLPLTLPTTLAQTQIPTEASSHGCDYYGPTYIVFQPSGGYTVNSPETTTTSSSGCYPSSPATISSSVNTNGVIYVQQCVAAPACVPASSPVSFTNANGNYVYSGPAVAGSAIVEGGVTGPFTVAAANNIYISGPLCYGTATCSSMTSSSASQVLGLVATDSILLASQMATSPLSTGSMNANPNGNIIGCPPASPPDTLCNKPEYFAYDAAGLGAAPLEAAIMALNGTFAYRATNTGNDKSPVDFVGSVAVSVPCTSDNVGSYATGGGMCDTNWAFLEQSHGNGKSGNGPQLAYDPNLATGLPPFFPTSTGSSGAPTFAANGFTEVANSYQPLGLS